MQNYCLTHLRQNIYIKIRRVIIDNRTVDGGHQTVMSNR